MQPHYLRAHTLDEATAWLRAHADARVLAGGQSLLPALRLGLGSASHLIDVQDVAELHALRLHGDTLFIGALCTHAQVAASHLVREQHAWLAEMARHIADPQVREMGTLGGSLANADPAACWPAAVLAAEAVIETTHHQYSADEFFQGLFTTALAHDELIVGVHFPSSMQAAYQKFEQPASRFAHPGVAVVRRTPSHVRVAVTGLGQGVVRWREAEVQLRANFSQSALQHTYMRPAQAEGDLHASAAYKVNLAHVLCRRILASLTGEAYIRVPAAEQHKAWGGVAQTPSDENTLMGERVIAASPVSLWHVLLSPQVLQACMPGCERVTQISPERYEAVVRVGLGLVSARFHSVVDLTPIQTPTEHQGGQMRLTVSGQAGAMGSARAEAVFSLKVLPDGQTQLHWQATPTLEGKLAQIGQRFVFAAARQLSDTFLDRLQSHVEGRPTVLPQSFWQRCLAWFRQIF